MKNKIIVILLIIIAVLLYAIWQLKQENEKTIGNKTSKAISSIEKKADDIIDNSKEYIQCHFNYNDLTFFEKFKCDLKYKYKIIK